MVAPRAGDHDETPDYGRAVTTPPASTGTSTQGPASYGDTFAAVYDDWYGNVSDVASTVAALARWARGGPVLELGVGTGRLALPLGARGVPLVGLDASAAMLAICADKRAGEPVHLVCGDMAAPPLAAPFSMVFVAFNTFFNLDSAQAQQACLARVAELLAPGGSFFVETFVPSPEPAHRDYREETRDDGARGTILTTTVRDPAGQTLRGVHIHSPAAGPTRRLPWSLRYLYPGQLDELCAAAGLPLADRWETWAGDAFSPSESPHHVSRYIRPRP